MKIGVTNSCLFVVMLATAGLSSSLVRAQNANRAPEDAVNKAEYVIREVQSGQQPSDAAAFGYSRSGGGSPFFSPLRTAPNVTSTIRKAAEAVRDAKGEDEKSAAQKKLAEVLSKCYDYDMVQREKELKQIEERLTKLRDLLERRRAKKQDIIDLQTKVALNEAEGLGFYDSERPAKVGPFTVTLPGSRVEAASAPAVPMPKAAPLTPKATTQQSSQSHED